MDGMVVRNEVTRCGQHWMEIMQMGRPVDVEEWRAKAPAAAAEMARCMRRHEKGVDVHRLWVWWPAREVVRLEAWQAKDLGVKEAVLWYVSKGQTVREAAGDAVWDAFRAWERWPARLYLREIPAGAPETVRPEGYPDVRLAVCGLAWAPSRYILVV